nr:hypothetical protein [Novosphingobium panipatense]
MTETQLDRLIDRIDRLLSEYLALRSASRENGPASIEDGMESILRDGLYPPDEPTSISRRALLAIGETLGLVGGMDLMLQVHAAYEKKFGIRKANSLSARWDSAAELWFD